MAALCSPNSVHLVGLKYGYLLSFGDWVSLLCKPSEQDRAFTHSTFADAHRAHSPRGRQSKGWESWAEIANTPFLFSSLRFQTWRKQVCSGLAAASLVLPASSVSCTFAEPSTYRRSQTQSQILPLISYVFPREQPHWLPRYYPQSKQLLPLIWPSIVVLRVCFAHTLLHRDYHKPWKISKFAFGIPACFEWGKGLGLHPN